MKRFGSRHSACAALVLGGAASMFGAAQATEIFRAHYEISVATNGSGNTVRSTFEARPGEQFTLDLPPNVVALSVRRLGAENYELQVTVKPSKPQAQDVLFSHTYQGILGRPLELGTAAEAVKLEGAISVVVLNR